LVLVSGAAPIRAKKARYYTDRRLAERVLPPPQLSAADAGVGMSANDWSGLAVSSGPKIPAVAGTAALLPTGDHANAGIRREPELPDQEEIVAEISTPTREFSFEEQDSEDGAVRAQVLRDQIRGLPRQSAMDPDDGLGL
jgi:type IV secretion system protein VirD4